MTQPLIGVIHLIEVIIQEEVLKGFVWDVLIPGGLDVVQRILEVLRLNPHKNTEKMGTINAVNR